MKNNQEFTKIDTKTTAESRIKGKTVQLTSKKQKYTSIKQSN